MLLRSWFGARAAHVARMRSRRAISARAQAIAVHYGYDLGAFVADEGAPGLSPQAPSPGAAVTEPKEGKLRIGPHPDGWGHGIWIDDVDYSRFATKAVLTIPVDARPTLELTLVVEDVQVETPQAGVIHFKVCANCSKELSARSCPACGPDPVVVP